MTKEEKNRKEIVIKKLKDMIECKDYKNLHVIVSDINGIEDTKVCYYHTNMEDETITDCDNVYTDIFLNEVAYCPFCGREVIVE